VNGKDSGLHSCNSGRSGKTIFHGLMSLMLVSASFVIGTWTLFTISAAAGIAEIVLLLIAVAAALGIFCTKCRCSESCTHILPGYITRILPRRTGSYTASELIVVMIVFAAPVIFPQFMIAGSIVLLTTFWLPLAAGVIEIVYCVCPECGNEFCPSFRARHLYSHK